MRKISTVILSVMLLTAIVGCSAIGNAESQYVSIKEIRETVPERWTGEYTDKKGNAIAIDTPIVVPEVDAVPVVRITWGGPYTNIDQSGSIVESDANHLIVEFPTSSNEGFTCDQAPEAYVRRLKEMIPDMQNRELANYMLIEETIEQYGKGYRMAFYSSFHGIPYLISNNFRIDVADERTGDLPPVPTNVTQGSLLNNLVGVTLCAAQEVGIDSEDIPLLDFAEILMAFEQWVTDGYVYSLDEMCFGYMAFIDPNKKGEEFVLVPVWTAKGITRGEVGMPFYPDEDPESLMFMGYMNPTVCAVNAQTGEKYAFVNDASKDRRYVPSIVTWDDVK